MDKNVQIEHGGNTSVGAYMFGMKKSDRESLDAYCKKNGITVSGYLKILVNEDMMRRGKEPIFQRIYKRKVKER